MSSNQNLEELSVLQTLNEVKNNTFVKINKNTIVSDIYEYLQK